jgi:hypothetical protein
MIEEIMKKKGRNFQFEGLSIHYLVGDAIKRNYNLLLSSVRRRGSVVTLGVETEQTDKDKDKDENRENVNL